MTESEIIELMKKLTPAERLSVVEATLRSIREELPQVQESPRRADKKQMAIAAEALLQDYTEGGDLTSFTALDSEDFHASE